MYMSTLLNIDYSICIAVCQSLTTNTLKRLMDQLEERILKTNQLKNTSKRLQHRIDPMNMCMIFVNVGICWPYRLEVS